MISINCHFELKPTEYRGTIFSFSFKKITKYYLLWVLDVIKFSESSSLELLIHHVSSWYKVLYYYLGGCNPYIHSD